MKTRHLIGSLPLLTLCCGLASAADEAPNPNVAEAKGIIQQFATELQGELQAAMQEGGPVQAIEVCKERAPGIAEELSAQTGWTVGRTSLKTRNVAHNRPDPWEAEVLARFDARQAAGEDVQTMAYAEVVDGEDGKRFRFMKAIPTAEICLACHGQDVAPKVAEALDAAYPDDQARGYEVGEVRGAFSLSKPL
ncbi:Tll0287-like domain-containing protein [Thiococcus pfennigii]|uniref:Tll0287-like domain-containing protein n=1 Tax=Thiococcus pfennigii TaxID=1057 RepID=UPI0019071817|nr:DUF3365 domain-containing protein [Thiococcus pfennigii]MBK1700706.1 glutamate synthase [Thiococcus pfennigii]MBK1730346.1 glutamate synthase [Thiococcus pfennigii]